MQASAERPHGVSDLAWLQREDHERSIPPAENIDQLADLRRAAIDAAIAHIEATRASPSGGGIIVRCRMTL